MRIVSVMYPKLPDLRCISHTLDIVGGKFKVPTLSLFMTSWVSLFAHSAKAKALWKDRSGRAIHLLKNTVVEQVRNHESSSCSVW